VAIIAVAAFVTVDALAIITGNGNLMGPVIIGPVLIAAYFAPTFIAAQRDIPNAASVAIVNLFLGWTCIGWVVALAMAVAGNRPSTQLRLPDASGPPPAPAKVATSATKKCPDCAETVLADARVCKHCGYRFAPAASSEPATKPPAPTQPTNRPKPDPSPQSSKPPSGRQNPNPPDS